MVSIKDLTKARLGGSRDAIALAAIMAGGFLTLPGLLGTGYLGTTGALLLACAGGAYLGNDLVHALRINNFQQRGGLEINSSKVPDFDPAGVNIGYVGDRAEPLVIPLAEWLAHAMIVGKSGVGKTVVGEWIMFQQVIAGGGLMWIDGKLDFGNLQKLWQMACWCGRGDDVLVINPGNPEMSNTYNPLLSGPADEIASVCASLIPASENNAGADFYRQTAAGAVGTLVSAIQSIGRCFSFSDLRVLLSNTRALEWLAGELEASGNEEESAHFALFLDQFRRMDKRTGRVALDLNEIKRTFGGLGSRLAQFGSGEFGKVMNAYDPEVKLKDCVMQGKILYVMLPTMGKSEAATALGKMVVGDFRSAIAAVQNLPEDERPKRPFLGFFDEAGSYVTQAWARMFEQARSARLVMVPAFQTKANLEVLGMELRAMVAGNTQTKIFFKPGEPDTAEWMAEMIGKEMQIQHSVSEGQSGSIHGPAGVTKSVTSGQSAGASRSLREGYKVTPDDLKKLGKGECIVNHDGHLNYKVHVPRLTFDQAFIDKVGPFHLNHPAGTSDVEGLNLLARAPAEFLGE